MSRYVGLLRGINVGGNNLIKMPALKACLEGLGMREVSTFIASGNVLFDAPKGAVKKVTAVLEAGLSKAFAYDARITLRSLEEMDHIVGKAPKGFGIEPAKYRYDVVFLFQPLGGDEALAQLSLKEGVDRAWAGHSVVYFSRLIAKAAQSRLTKLISLPIYKQMTIRNWNTTTKLHKLLAGA